MEKPLGYVAQGETSQVCLLNSAIYRLKQSPRIMFVKFNGLFTTYVFLPCQYNRIVMGKIISVGCVVPATYVDHILWLASQNLGLASKGLAGSHPSSPISWRNFVAFFC